MEYEAFELVSQDVKAEMLSNKAWHYVRKITEKLDLERIGERKMLLQTIAANKGLVERMAIEIADVSVATQKLIERRKEEPADDVFKLLKRIDAVLKKFEIEAINPIGQLIDDDLADFVRVIENVPKSGVDVHKIGETVDVIVKLKGKVIRSGKVIGWYPKNAE